ncbi:hypothetical protein D9611_002728 [Ephemerocybe angulata]|uniref:TRP C-terminal domain-containing protein n=1 Tax=Ephemerocybe angulata TaxID=980116 RepID=A0A8H5FDX2_9AGAR|nr:hypothetical protein D9611_002728 [Tulosesus angulatus]
MSKSSSLLPLSLISFLSLFIFARADPVSLPYKDCFDASKGVDNKFAIDTVYAQVLKNEAFGTFLNLTVFGNSPSTIVGTTNASGSLAGPFAFSSSIPWGNNRELTTLNTRLRAVDPFGVELVCIDVATTPLDPTPHAIYGKANIILWSTVGLAVAYWFVVGVARVSSAWNRGISRSGKGLWAKAQSAGFILASAVSGERLANSPALLRFCTPSMRDVVFHTQWCALLGMVAVEWPQFAYPLLTQTAWSTLSYNVSLTRGASEHWNPLFTPPYDPPTGFADQLSDPKSPLFIDPNVPNTLYTLPPTAGHGISSFAYTLGIRPQDLFPTCLVLFLGVAAGTIVISGVFWFIDVFVTSVLQKFTGNTSAYGPTGRGLKSPAFSTSKEVETPLVLEEDRPLATGKGLGFALPTSSSPGPMSASPSGDRGYHRSWWFMRFRSDIGSFHGNVLHGNLVRILILFHLPVTAFSCYHMTLPHSVIPTSSIALAALSFTFFSILLPAHLVIRVTLTSTNKLYDDMRTLLSLGPLYNHYRHGSQLFASLLFATNLAFGVTIGAGQKSGTAQAIIILVVEVVSALVTSIWLPWGTGASMGLISFLFCVARIVVAVLLVILTPTISVGAGPGGWVAYGILIVLALVYLALVILLLVKFVEALVRILGGVGFDRSRHVVDSGIVGACGMLGCCGSKRRKRNNKGKRPGANGRPGDKYKSSELGQSPSSQHLGSTLLKKRNSDLSSYNPPAALLHADGSDHGSINAPRFLGGADSRKGSTHSQPPSVLRPEHANQPYREDTDREWWNENEGQGGAFIMGAWQPFGSTTGNAHGQASGSGPGYMPVANVQPSKPSPQAATPSTGFSRVGGGRAHIDSPYAITPTGNSHSQLGLQTGGSTHTFPSIGAHGAVAGGHISPSLSQGTPAATPLQSGSSSHHHPSAASATSYPPSAFSRQYNQPSYVVEEDEPAFPLSSVRQAHSTPMQMQTQTQNDFGALPPGAMQPAHIRTKSQTAIIEDAGSSLYGPGGLASPTTAGNPASQTGISARLSSHQSLQPIKIPSFSGGLSPAGANSNPKMPTSAPPMAMFTLAADDDDNDDESVADDQQQKKKWYQLRKKRPHSSEGRATATTTSAGTPTAPSAITGGSSSSMPLPVEAEFGGHRGEGSGGEGSSSATPQRSFVVIRKPMGSMGRLNQATAASASASAQQSQAGMSSRSRPPTR